MKLLKEGFFFFFFFLFEKLLLKEGNSKIHDWKLVKVTIKVIGLWLTCWEEGKTKGERNWVGPWGNFSRPM